MMSKPKRKSPVVNILMLKIDKRVYSKLLRYTIPKGRAQLKKPLVIIQSYIPAYKT